jgi:hypothetical protein
MKKSYHSIAVPTKLLATARRTPFRAEPLLVVTALVIS